MAVTGNPGFSIVICCYNSEARLPATLKHIASLIIPAELPCELLIINNASVDNTLQAVLAEWSKYSTPISLRVLDEPLLGLTNARRTGFAEALYDYVIWCDDDNWLSSNYLLVAAGVFERNANIGIIGAYGTYSSESDTPEWMRFSQLFFAIGPQEAVSGPVKGHRVYGAGAVIYKPAYEKLISAGYQQLLTDRLGNNLASGGDYEICYAIALAGYTIWYEEDLRFTHYFPSFRLTRPYYLRLIKESAPCLTTLDAYSIVLNGKSRFLSVNYVNYIFRHISYFCKQIFVFFLKEMATDKNSAYGFFVATRTAFFRIRFKGFLLNLADIYANSKRINQFKLRLGKIGVNY